MTKTKTLGILCTVLLVAMSIVIPLSNHAFASSKTKTSGTKDIVRGTDVEKIKKASKTTPLPKTIVTSNATKASISKDILEKRNKEIQSHHKKINK